VLASLPLSPPQQSFPSISPPKFLFSFRKVIIYVWIENEGEPRKEGEGKLFIIQQQENFEQSRKIEYD
jgi:hypothetical protein